jgi:uncharacterized protein YlzI (FlbEa/FlbD family)
MNKKMIRVIREDGVEILLNASVIEKVEDDKDRNAVITLGTGEIVKAKSPAYDIVGKMKAYWQGLGQERREYDKAVEKAVREKDKEDTPKAERKPREKPRERSKESPRKNMKRQRKSEAEMG